MLSLANAAFQTALFFSRGLLSLPVVDSIVDLLKLLETSKDEQAEAYRTTLFHVLAAASVQPALLKTFKDEVKRTKTYFTDKDFVNDSSTLEADSAEEVRLDRTSVARQATAVLDAFDQGEIGKANVARLHQFVNRNMLPANQPSLLTIQGSGSGASSELTNGSGPSDPNVLNRPKLKRWPTF